jgi:hypothetical protein
MKKGCTCNNQPCATRWLAIILFLFTLPLFSFWAGYEVAKVESVKNQMSIIDDARATCSPSR